MARSSAEIGGERSWSSDLLLSRDRERERRGAATDRSGERVRGRYRKSVREREREKERERERRNMCVNNTLGKILCIIINSRLVQFLSENNVLSKSQIVFLPTYRMTDHVFPLHTLIDKQTYQNMVLPSHALFI